MQFRAAVGQLINVGVTVDVTVTVDLCVDVIREREIVNVVVIVVVMEESLYTVDVVSGVDVDVL